MLGEVGPRVRPDVVQLVGLVELADEAYGVVEQGDDVRERVAEEAGDPDRDVDSWTAELLQRQRFETDDATGLATMVAPIRARPLAKRSRMGRKLPLISERPVSNEMSLGISSFSRLSWVCVTCTPVPRVACSIVRRWFSIREDQTFPMTAPAAPPRRAPS